MLEKELEMNKKSLDKFKKLSEEVLRERDAIRKDLKRAESKWFVRWYCDYRHLLWACETKISFLVCVY